MSYKVFAEDEEISNIAGDGKAYAESTTATAGDVLFTILTLISFVLIGSFKTVSL